MADAEKKPWVCPEDGQWTQDDVAEQHIEDLEQIRTGAMLQIARIAAGESLNSESALAIVTDAMCKVVEVYDNHQVMVYTGEPDRTTMMPLGMTQRYYDRINT
jgi:ABC-type Fe3+-hydroxamate transport system substrate-binding protein